MAKSVTRCPATAKIQLKPPITVENGPFGTQDSFEVVDVLYNVNARVHDPFAMPFKDVACADWMLASPEGAATLDVRGTMETGDGAIDLRRTPGSRRATPATPG